MKRLGYSTLRAVKAFGPAGRGRLHVGPFALPCALGPAGVSRSKREGDGASPAGRFAIVQAYWRADRAPRPRLSIAPRSIRGDDLWCDDPASPLYNRPARAPLKAGAERMRREDQLYDLVFTLDHNQRPRVRGFGSAIFLHVAREGFTPTQGCVALAPEAMRRLAPLLRRGATLTIA